MPKLRFAVLCAAVTAAAAVPSFGVSAEPVESVVVYDEMDGTYIEAWRESRHGTMDMQKNPDGSCSAEWEGVSDCILWNGFHAYDPIPVYYLSQLDVRYEAEIEAADTTVWYGVIGFCNRGRGKLDMFYVIDGWNRYRPCSDRKPDRTVAIDGTLYDQYYVVRSQGGIDPPPADVELWSIRCENAYVPGEKNHCTGKVSLAEHFFSWAEGREKLAELDWQIVYYGCEVSDYDGICGTSAVCTIQKPEVQISYENGVRPKTVQYPARDDSEPYRQHQNKDYSYAASGLAFKDIMGPYFRIGAAVSEEGYNQGSGGSVWNRFNSVAGMGDFKPSAIVTGVEDTEVRVNLHNADGLLNYAGTSGRALRGSAFIIPGMTPDAMLHCTPETADARIESLIRNTFAAYKNDYPELTIYSYDVCDEIFKPEGGGLRTAADGNGWAEIYGDDSIQPYLTAFKAAREYAPAGCKLFLSDFNEYMPEKCADICGFAKKVMAEGDYIDGIGMQSHLKSYYPDKTTYESALKKFTALGLDVQITELDITAESDPALPEIDIPMPEEQSPEAMAAYDEAAFEAEEERREAQYEKRDALWKDIFSAAMRYADHISSVTLWDPFRKELQNDTYPLWSWADRGLFDQYGNPNPAYYDILRLTEEIAPPVQTEGPILLPPQAQTTAATAAQIPDTKTGDANCDGSVDVADAVLVLRYISEDETANIADQGVKNGDVNRDGQTDTADASLILQYIARKITF